MTPKNLRALAIKAAEHTGRVMVRDPSRDAFGPKARRHLRLHLDDGGPYVRTGKRGQCKEYLVDARIACKDPLVVTFTSERT